MKSAWLSSVLSLLIGLLLCGTGGAFLADALKLRDQADRGEGLVATTNEIDVAALAEKTVDLEREQQRLVAVGVALRGGTGVFQERLTQTFDALRLQVVTSTAWRGVSPLKAPPALRGFERDLTLEGSFGAVLDLLHALENWPDGVRVRQLDLEPVGPDRVRARLTLVVHRLLPPSTPPQGT
jgi:hypothetical protein